MTPHPLGRKVEHDEKSRSFPVRLVADTPTSVRWRKYGAVLNQGNLGACTGLSMAHAANTEGCHVPNTALLDGNDARSLYSRATVLDAWPGQWPTEDTGSSGLAVCKAATEKGLLSRYEWAFGFEHFLLSIQRGPMMLGTWWYNSMFTPVDKAGTIRVVESSGTAGGHEYTATGIDVKAKWVYFVNSWGKEWGNSGRFRMSFADVSLLLSQDGDAILPVGSTVSA